MFHLTPITPRSENTDLQEKVLVDNPGLPQRIRSLIGMLRERTIWASAPGSVCSLEEQVALGMSRAQFVVVLNPDLPQIVTPLGGEQ